MKLSRLFLCALLLGGAARAEAPYVAPETPLGSGPYPAIMLQEPTLATHTVYRPANLTAPGLRKLPIIAWGNGACVNVGNRFRYFLTEIASHGFFAVAIGPIGPKEAENSTSSGDVRGKPAAVSPAARRTAGSPPINYIPSDTTAGQLTEAIDWAIAENSRPGSPYFGKLDTSKVAVMGQSCGGLQATAAARDPRVSVLGVWNSGLFTDAQRVLDIAAADAPKSMLPTLRVASIYVTGDSSDQAFKNADDDFERIAGPSLRLWREQTAHKGTYREPNGGAFGPVAVAFLKWRLQGDQQAARMFMGPDCELCKKPEWHLRKKNID
jgi:dienelactone hydrolase